MVLNVPESADGLQADYRNGNLDSPIYKPNVSRTPEYHLNLTFISDRRYELTARMSETNWTNHGDKYRRTRASQSPVATY